MTLEFAILLIVIAVFVADVVAKRRRRRRLEPVADAPEDEPYRIFTTEFDWTGKADDLSYLLNADHPDFPRGWTDKSGERWRVAWALANERMPDAATRHALIADARGRIQSLVKEPVAISLLVDQSGSMKGETMAATFVALDVALSALAIPGITTELLGYSTVGWQGGKARLHWIERGRPARPGRLCALQQVIYKSAADERWDEDSKRWMMHPDLLRENIDGEALRWASARLREISASTKVLMVV